MSYQDESSNPVPAIDPIVDNYSRVLFITRMKEPFEIKMGFPGVFIKKEKELKMRPNVKLRRKRY